MTPSLPAEPGGPAGRGRGPGGRPAIPGPVCRPPIISEDEGALCAARQHQALPRDFTDEQQKQLAEAITTVILANFETDEGAVLIALEPVEKAEWSEKVVVPEVTEREHLLLKVPNYRKEGDQP